MSSPCRIVFMGTPELARTVFMHLADAGPALGSVVGVFAQPDKPVGRNLHLSPPPVKVEALARGIPVFQPAQARDPESLQQLREWQPDVVVVAAYGQILPQALLDVPRYGCINVHTSLLPRWRGAAPIQWAIAEGDSETGVSLMRMEAGLDTGPVFAVARTPVLDTDNGSTLHDRLAILGAELLVQSLPGYLDGSLPPATQPIEGVTYARKISRDDGRLDWSLPARTLWRRVRAFTPWPGAFCRMPLSDAPDSPTRLLKVHSVEPDDTLTGVPGKIISTGKDGIAIACGSGGLKLLEVQPEGGRRMPAAAFAAGHSIERLV